MFALLCTSLVALSIGYACGVFIKKTTLPQLIGFIILLISATLAGQFVPLSVIADSEAVRIVSIFSPLTYPLSLINCATLEKAPFDSILQSLSEQGIQKDDLTSVIDDLTNQYNSISSGANIFDVKDATRLIAFAPLTPEVVDNHLFFKTIVLYHP